MSSFLDLMGPDLTPDAGAKLKKHFRVFIGFEIEDFELRWLHSKARHIGVNRAVHAPVSKRSHKVIDDLRKSTWKLLVALEEVRSASAEPIDLTRHNIASDYIADSILDNEDEEEDWFLVDPTEIVVEPVAKDVRVLHRRATRALNSGKRMERRQGRRVTGYPQFIVACREVWQRHREDKGWSTKNGRGSGPFVTFVWIAQWLLPPPMRKRSYEAVGDAIGSALKETK